MPVPFDTTPNALNSSSGVTAHQGTEIQYANHGREGPQCCHCGWRGGSHQYVLPSSRSSPQIKLLLPAQDAPSSNATSHHLGFILATKTLSISSCIFPIEIRPFEPLHWLP
ncbi:hypothetical protein DFH09DRAFT_1079966 [Mycena vulgaris]|nr:hypothetical protein DFH09DRAFT_1079966 [Mycena vulgaris]